MKTNFTEKATRIVNLLEAIEGVAKKEEDQTLKVVTEIITEKVKFYDDCVASWHREGIAEKWSAEEIEIGKKCGNAGLDMADSIVNELRILFLGK